MSDTDARSPLISIVTATYNRADWIAKAIDSVGGRHPLIEHIVIDGASTDSTLEVLSQYPHLRIVSEPDAGVYDAWNRGVALASGRYISFLNSDDEYVPGAIDRLILAVSALEEPTDIITGGFELVDEAGTVAMRCIPPGSLSLTLENILIGSPAINARLIARSLFTVAGEFDVDLRTIADKEFLIRLQRSGVRESFVRDILYRYVSHSGSLTLSSKGVSSATQKEVATVLRKYSEEPDLPRRSLRTMRTWHARRVAFSVLDAWRQRDSGAAVRAARDGFGLDAVWPLRAALSRFSL